MGFMSPCLPKSASKKVKLENKAALRWRPTDQERMKIQRRRDTQGKTIISYVFLFPQEAEVSV